MMFDRGHMGNNGYWSFDMFNNGWSLLAICGIILVVIATVYFYKKKNSNVTTGTNAIEFLKIKFAKGELAEKEYLAKKEIINRK